MPKKKKNHQKPYGVWKAQIFSRELKKLVTTFNNHGALDKNGMGCYIIVKESVLTNLIFLIIWVLTNVISAVFILRFCDGYLNNLKQGFPTVWLLSNTYSAAKTKCSFMVICDTALHIDSLLFETTKYSDNFVFCMYFLNLC